MDSKKYNWNAWYAAIVIVLVLQIIFYYWFTQYWQ